ncbi:MAG: ATP-dependent DNA ligase [Phycisphaerales bacterium]|nr:ATP-dependent DNA ligase [Phycisphaerales bacterium]
MLRFARLYDELDQTTRTSEKLAGLQSYFREAPPEDAAWGLYFLSGGRHKRAVSATVLRDSAAEASGYPAWLLGECYSAVGDFSETIALLLPEPSGTITPRPLHEVVEKWIQPLQKARDVEKRRMLPDIWSQLDSRQRFVFHKLISGTFRVGAARGLVVRALAAVAAEGGRTGGAVEIDAATMEHRVMGNWEPTAAGFLGLLQGRAVAEEGSGLYPFCLANQLNGPPETLGNVADYLIEHKWDGIRAQLIRRPSAEILVWSRGEELVTDRFPEAAAAGAMLESGTVLDGEILIWEDTSRVGQAADTGSPRPFAELQTRINRKPVPGTPSRKKNNGQLGLFGASDLAAPSAAATPIPFPGRGLVFMAYDVIEHAGGDVRPLPMSRRRELLEEIVRGAAARAAGSTWLPLRISPLVHVNTWGDAAAIRERSRESGVEGLMLKPRASVYGVGRARGSKDAGGGGWWKWKIDPYSVDAVLMYAQPGTGKRAGIYSDQTFGVWDESAPGARELVPFAKAYSGLTDEELREVDAYVRRNTLEKSGPVRMVKPELVFEIAFEGIQVSTRHRSGIAVRFPRIKAWRRDKKARDADTLETVRALLHASLARSSGVFRTAETGTGTEGHTP